MANDDANPHGMFRPGHSGGPSKFYVVGKRMPKTRDHRVSRADTDQEPDTFIEPDQASPHGIPRPRLED